MNTVKNSASTNPLEPFDRPTYLGANGAAARETLLDDRDSPNDENRLLISNGVRTKRLSIALAC